MSVNRRGSARYPVKPAGRRGRPEYVWILSMAGALAAAVGLAADAALGQHSVVGSLHDLSVSGPGRIHAFEEEQVCIFCHAPHHNSGQRPLWNRYLPPTNYRIYESSTTEARIDQPSGPSKMCLSCHDGALALGLVVSRSPTEPIVMSKRTMPPGPSDLTQDLSDDHPIGFHYDRALAARDRQIKDPNVVSPLLPMGAHNTVHCTTCHDPHDNSLGNFLRMPEVRSTICLACHRMHGWELGSHGRSPARIHGRAVVPGERLSFNTVADNACNSCHRIHNAEQPERLLRFRRPQDNCLNCHDGSVARANIASEFRKPSRHPIFQFEQRHDPTENPLTMRRHVTCVDCHNPHAAAPDLIRRPEGAPLGLIDQTMQYSTGINRFGRPVERSRYDYEVCFKCHADGISNRERPDIYRQVNQNNTRLEFQPTNPSFHPIIQPRFNNDVVSLIPPLRVGSVIRCTSCHNSDLAGGGVTFGPSGPHGSIYDPILIDNYTTADFTMESAHAYALCYRCHDRQSILNDQSFPLHRRHIVQARSPCSACHDAHGISRTQGTSRNHSNLINFDVMIVHPANGGLGPRIEYEDTGPRQGNCTLTCHGVVHVHFEYGT